MKHSSFDATILALDAEMSVLVAETSALTLRRRWSCGVTDNIGAEFLAIAELV